MDEDEVTAFKCTVCGALYEEEEDATACHGNSAPVEAWACGRCGTIYESREEAHNCDSAV